MDEQATRTPLVVGAQADAMLMGATGPSEDASGWVEHDEAGVPIAFRLFAFGAFSVTQNGETYKGEFTPQHAARILDYFRNKGTRVPVDTQHVLHAIAEALKVTGADQNLTPDRVIVVGEDERLTPEEVLEKVREKTGEK